MISTTIVLLLIIIATKIIHIPNGIAVLINGIGFGAVSTAVTGIVCIPKFEKLYSNTELRFIDHDKSNPVQERFEKMVKKWKTNKSVSATAHQIVYYKELCQKSYTVSIAECRAEISKWHLLRMEINEMDDRSQSSAGSQSFRGRLAVSISVAVAQPDNM